MSRTAPKVLFFFYLILFAYCAIAPFDRATWWAENIPIIGIVLTLSVLYIRGVIFSPLSYFLMSILLYLHTIGGYYTFERVPFGELIFGDGRNNYDRVAHFTVGFYAYAIAEWLVISRSASNRGVIFLFPIFAIAFVAMSYELMEWQYAVIYGGPSAASFLGSQGDIWDAQKDMLADTLGALTVMLLFAAQGRLSKDLS